LGISKIHVLFFFFMTAGKILEASAVILLIGAWFVPVGWPLLVVLLVFFFGPFVVIWGLSYGYTTSSSGADQPLLNN
jgi:hypothetical protein